MVKIFQDLFSNHSIDDQIKDYFNEKSNKNINLKETLIVKFENNFNQATNNIFEKMDKLEETYYMPLVLILYKEENANPNKGSLIGIKEYENIYNNIEPRLIKIEKYPSNTEDISSIIEEKISPTLLRFYYKIL